YPLAVFGMAFFSPQFFFISLLTFYLQTFQTEPATAGLRFGAAALRRFLTAGKYRFYPSFAKRKT
ncbi:MAG: hypothetical protein ACOX7A_10190, partial [Lawsonibacter sp.]